MTKAFNQIVQTATERSRSSATTGKTSVKLATPLPCHDVSTALCPALTSSSACNCGSCRDAYSSYWACRIDQLGMGDGCLLDCVFDGIGAPTTGCHGWMAWLGALLAMLWEATLS